jgi:PAS domain S-box-containing protein
MDNFPATDSPNLPPLESVLCTEELNRRPSRPPDYEKESRALVSLAKALSDSPASILQTLADTILEVFQADSAGISLVTEDEQSFYWPAIAGMWKPHIGGGTPRDFGPCGDVLDRNAPLLFNHFERRYTYFKPVTPPVEECLLVPFYFEGKAVGTIWAIAHDDRRKFDKEDLRMLVSLGTFASASYQAAEQLQVLKEQDRERQNADQNLREMNEALLVSSMKQHELVEQAQKAGAVVRESEERYRALFESAPMAVFVCDSNAVIQRYNAQAMELWGREPICGIERHCGSTKLWLPDGSPLPHALSPIVDVLRTGVAVHNVEVLIERPDGTRLPVLVNFAALKNAQGEITGAVTSFIDITERSRLERQTQEQAEALAELHQRKDEFLAMLSHELRNPLSAIFNALHILRLQNTDNPIQQKARVVIERQVGQLAHLVDDLLEVSRVITGGIQLHQERLEMRGIVDRAIESVRPLIDKHKHELKVSLPAEPIWLQGDPTRFEQVVVNLLNNAAKYTDKGGLIHLTAQQEGTEVVLRVRDNGIGIATELLPRIFDLFTQADRMLDRSQGGLGIGLSLVQKLVELHGGTVTAQSAGLRQGSEFIVRLPALSPASESITPIETATPQAHTSRVLVVDDNKDAADMLAMMLQMFGHKVQTAYDGQTALETAAEYQPDFVLLDIGLPDMNGYEVARRLRQQPGTKDVLLIAMTGYGQDSDRQQSQEAGFDHHLVKPVEPQKLQDLLETLAKKPRPETGKGLSFDEPPRPVRSGS